MTVSHTCAGHQSVSHGLGCTEERVLVDPDSVGQLDKGYFSRHDVTVDQWAGRYPILQGQGMHGQPKGLIVLWLRSHVQIPVVWSSGMTPAVAYNLVQLIFRTSSTADPGTRPRTPASY